MKRFLLVSLIALICVVSLAVPAFAQSNPAPPPSVVGSWVFRSLLESNDSLYVWYARINYNTIPPIPVNQAFVWELREGATLVGITSGSAYQSNGYGYNVYSAYFDNVTAPSWGATISLKLLGTPYAFTDPPEYNFTIPASSYTALTSQADNQAALAQRIIALATDLNTQWALAAAYYLTEETETTTVLSIYGAAVFRAAIYGIQGMAPSLFDYIVENINVPDRTWTAGYSENLTSQWSGTWVQTAQEGFKLLLGVDWDLGSLLLMLVLAALAGWGTILIGGNVWAAGIDASIVLVFAARLGFVNLFVLMFMAALAWIFISWVLFHPLRG